VSQASRDELPIVAEMADGAYVGRGAEWGDMTVAFEMIAAGDPAPLFQGLPDDRCQCPHWGYLLKGKMAICYDGHDEIVTPGQAYYMAPGHRPLFLEDSETLEFSPTAALAKTMEVVSRNVAALPQPTA
jgi:hypothetical protein